MSSHGSTFNNTVFCYRRITILFKKPLVTNIIHLENKKIQYEALAKLEKTVLLAKNSLNGIFMINLTEYF